MGTDLVAKVADGFERRQRRSLEQLEEPNLFTRPPRMSHALTVTPVAGHTFSVGEHYRLTLVDDRIVIVDGVSRAGYVENPPPSLLDTMRTMSPSSRGCIRNVSEITQQAEIVLE
jgi:hypothetical protein